MGGGGGGLAWTIRLLTITLKCLNLAPQKLVTFSFNRHNLMHRGYNIGPENMFSGIKNNFPRILVDFWRGVLL